MSNWLKRGWVEWMLLGIIAVGVIPVLPVGRRWPMRVQDAGFFAFVAALFWCAGLGWWRFRVLRRERGWRKWRVWASLIGCGALSLALAIPILAIFSFGFLVWDFLTAWVIAAMSALLLGFFAERPVRFPLVLGSLGMVSLVVLIPKGVL